MARISLFPGPPPSGPLPSATELYKQVWNLDPESFQSNPNALVPAIAQGSRGGITYTCSVHPIRIDFSLMPPAPSREEVNTRLLLIEDSSQVHAELVRIINFIAERTVSDSIIRVGVYVHLTALAADITEANKVLTETMPQAYRIPLTADEELIFQINQPRMSQMVEGVRLNLVTKWSTDRFQVLNVPLISSNATLSMNAPQAREFIAASVIFDNNNVAATSPLTCDKQSSILRECLTTSEDLQKALGIRLEES